MGKTNKNEQLKKTKKQLIKESSKYSSEDESFNIKRLIIITSVVLIFVGAIYFVTAKFVIKDASSQSNTTKAEINYDVVSVGTILNRSYDEYYVLVFDSSSNKASYYENIALAYSNTEGAKKIYTCDLNNGLNSKYKSNTEFGNSKATTISEFSFGEITLLYIKNNKVTKYIESTENINKEFDK